MMKNIMKTFLYLLLVVFIISCANKESKQKTILSTKKELTAADILGNPKLSSNFIWRIQRKNERNSTNNCSVKRRYKTIARYGNSNFENL